MTDKPPVTIHIPLASHRPLHPGVQSFQTPGTSRQTRGDPWKTQSSLTSQLQLQRLRVGVGGARREPPGAGPPRPPVVPPSRSAHRRTHVRARTQPLPGSPARVARDLRSHAIAGGRNLGEGRQGGEGEVPAARGALTSPPLRRAGNGWGRGNGSTCLNSRANVGWACPSQHAGVVESCPVTLVQPTHGAG